MPNKKTKNYTAEFKEAAIKLVTESNQSLSETAKDLGIAVSTLSTWISKYHKPANNSQSGQEHIYDELKQLRKENARLKEEHAILKKAAAFFARESR